MCGTCKVKLVSGVVDMKHAGGIRQREIDQGMVLLCCSKPLSRSRRRQVGRRDGVSVATTSRQDNSDVGKQRYSAILAGDSECSTA
jgi:hypothetical protein